MELKTKSFFFFFLFFSFFFFFIRNGGNAIPKHAAPEAERSNPTTGLTVLWALQPGILDG